DFRYHACSPFGSTTKAARCPLAPPNASRLHLPIALLDILVSDRPVGGPIALMAVRLERAESALERCLPHVPPYAGSGRRCQWLSPRGLVIGRTGGRRDDAI